MRSHACDYLTKQPLLLGSVNVTPEVSASRHPHCFQDIHAEHMHASGATLPSQHCKRSNQRNVWLVALPCLATLTATQLINVTGCRALLQCPSLGSPTVFLASAHWELSVALVQSQGYVYCSSALLRVKASGRPVMPGEDATNLD
jgi:hypothetical protein